MLSSLSEIKRINSGLQRIRRMNVPGICTHAPGVEHYLWCGACKRTPGASIRPQWLATHLPALG